MGSGLCPAAAVEESGMPPPDNEVDHELYGRTVAHWCIFVKMKRAATIEVTPEDSLKRRILAATLRLIAAEGLDAVRHRRVADMAEVSLGSTTYHFASRDGL